MWNENKQKRVDELRLREAGGTLQKAEWAELDALFAELDTEEAETMQPALKHQQQRGAKLQKEKEPLGAKVAQLEDIVSEQGRLLTDAHSYLDRLQVRRATLADKYYRITGHELPVSR